MTCATGGTYLRCTANCHIPSKQLTRTRGRRPRNIEKAPLLPGAIFSLASATAGALPAEYEFWRLAVELVTDIGEQAR